MIGQRYSIINVGNADKRWLPVEIEHGEVAIDLARVPDTDGNGAPDLAVLTIRPGGEPVVGIFDSRSGDRINTIQYPVSPNRPLAVTAIADIDGSGVAEIGVLSRRATGQARV